MTQHLIDQNRRRILYISGPSQLMHEIERLEGYIMTLKRNALPVCDELIAKGDFLSHSGYSIVKQAIANGLEFDAVQASNDQAAIGAIKAIKAHGLRIPQDIAVVGFDNLSISSMIEPALTTMRPPALQMGRMAARLACSADRQSFARENKFDVKLVIRKSSDETCTSEWELTGW